MGVRRIGTAIAILVLAFAGTGTTRAETIKLGLQKTGGNAGIYVAQERGYFTAENLTVQFVYFDAAMAVSVGTRSGRIDIGSTALTAALYNMAARGAMHIIAAQSADVPSFQNNTVIASNSAYESGLKSYKDLGGRKIGLAQIGGTPQYAIVLLAEKYGFPLKTVRFMPQQSVGNVASAVAGNQVDVGVGPAPGMLPVVQRGYAKLLGFTGDDVTFQLGGIFVTTKTANKRGDMLKRFLIAYRHGAKDYHDAVTGPDGRRQDEPDTDAIVAILSKYIGLKPEQLKPALAYVDVDARLDQHDVQNQINWYRSQGQLKGKLTAAELIDKRYATILPGRE